MNNAALATRRTESISRGVGVTTQIYADRAENAEI
jgi:4-aminobutyrate aminotransferase